MSLYKLLSGRESSEVSRKQVPGFSEIGYSISGTFPIFR